MVYKPTQVKNSLSIGRGADNDWVINVGTVSSKHASLQKISNTEWLFKDLGSANGSEVNGQSVSEVVIKATDRLTFCRGTVQLDTNSLFTSPPPPPPPPHEPKPAPNEFTYLLPKLKEIHEEYHKKQKDLRQAHSWKTRGIPAFTTTTFMLVTYFLVQDQNMKLAFLGLSGGLGAAIGVVVGNMFDLDEPLRKLNEDYALKYKCKVKGCDRSLGLHNSPRILEGQKTCPCGKNCCK